MKALLFDFGGTLDTNGVHWSEKFWEVYQRLGIQISKGDFERGYVAAESRIAEGIVQWNDSFRATLRKQVSLQFEALRLQEKYDEILSSTGLPERVADESFEDVRRTIRQQLPVLEACRRQYALGIVSNFYGNLATVCEELRIGSLFNTIVDSARVGVRKPDPKIFSLAIEQLGVTAPDTLVLGDSYDRDIVPAKSLGCTTVWLRGKSWTNPADTSNADYVIYSLETMRSFLPSAMITITT